MELKVNFHNFVFSQTNGVRKLLFLQSRKIILHIYLFEHLALYDLFNEHWIFYAPVYTQKFVQKTNITNITQRHSPWSLCGIAIKMSMLGRKFHFSEHKMYIVCCLDNSLINWIRIINFATNSSRKKCFSCQWPNRSKYGAANSKLTNFLYLISQLYYVLLWSENMCLGV